MNESLQFMIEAGFGTICFNCGYLIAFIVTRNKWSANLGLCFRETGFCRAETPAPKRPVNFQPIVRRDKVPPRNPANSGLFLGNREISVYEGTAGWCWEDSNRQPSGYEHTTPFGKSNKNWHFRQRSATFVHPRLRRFIGYLLVERRSI